MSTTANGGDRRTTCASCGRPVAAGARYCIHCGAEQSLPTPIAAVAAAMARGQPREAANAAHADPARGRSGTPPAATETAPAASLAATATPEAANTASPVPPAYDAGPPRTRLAAVVVGCLVAVSIALGAVALWRADRGGDTTPGEAQGGATSSNAAPPTATLSSATPPAAEATTQTGPFAAPAPAAAELAPGTPASSTGAPSAAASPSAQSAPVEIKVLPPHTAARPSPHRNATEQTASAPPTLPAPPPSAVTPPAPVAKATAASAAPPVPRVASRWQHLDEELSRCTREDFITRVICGQRARFRYCDGYWGKVPQCPGNSAGEHGQ